MLIEGRDWRGQVIDCPASGKAGVLREIVRQAKEDPALAGRGEDELVSALEAREKVGSTGFGGGTAIPHCHLRGLADFVVGLVVVRDGVEFAAADGRPVHVLVYIFAPAERRNEHLALLASLSRLLADSETVNELAACTSAETLLQRFGQRWQPPAREQVAAEQSLLQILVQSTEVLTDILQVLAENGAGSLAVLEGRNAGSYLHRVPLVLGLLVRQPRALRASDPGPRGAGEVQ